MSIGTAKPTPSPPPPVDWIWELIPITRPFASSSGPPELPWLMAASVWIAFPILKAVRESMSRLTAEITPIDSDCCSPNGLPMAATGSPTWRPLEEPSGTGVRLRPAGFTLSSATSELRSAPTTFALTLLPSENCT